MCTDINVMLSYLISIPVTGFAIWLVLRNAAQLYRRRASWGWWTVLVTIVIVGAYAGRQLSHCEVRVSPEFVRGGLPLPIGFFHLEEGQWTDYVLPHPAQWCNIVADTVIPIMVLLLPWTIARRRWLPAETSASLIPNP